MNRLPAFLPHDQSVASHAHDPEADHFKDVPACEIGFAEAEQQPAVAVEPATIRPHYVTVLFKGSERYYFIYDNTQESLAATLRTVGRYASDKDLSFSWFDAAVVSQRIRATVNVGK